MILGCTWPNGWSWPASKYLQNLVWKNNAIPKKKTAPAKRKKLNVIPGRSVAAEDTPEKISEENLPSTSKIDAVKRKIGQESQEDHSDSEFEDNLEITSSSDSENIQECETSSSDYEDDVFDNQLSIRDIKIDTWVIVEYLSKKTAKYYVGKVISINKYQEAEIQFVKKYKGDKFVWPDINDIDHVPISNIKKVISPPKIGRRNELYFDIDILCFNIT